MAKRRWWTRVAVAVMLVLLGWVLFISLKQLERNRRIQDEVSLLEAEAAKIRRENQTFAEKISYFSSDNFREQEAKKKLGLKKTEETVVVIKPSPEPGTAQENGAENHNAVSEESEDIPNYKKWWRMFF